MSSHSHTPSSSEAGDSGICKLIRFLSLAQSTEGEECLVERGSGLKGQLFLYGGQQHIII